MVSETHFPKVFTSCKINYSTDQRIWETKINFATYCLLDSQEARSGFSMSLVIFIKLFYKIDIQKW